MFTTVDHLYGCKQVEGVFFVLFLFFTVFCYNKSTAGLNITFIFCDPQFTNKYRSFSINSTMVYAIWVSRPQNTLKKKKKKVFSPAHHDESWFPKGGSSKSIGTTNSQAETLWVGLWREWASCSSCILPLPPSIKWYLHQRYIKGRTPHTRSLQWAKHTQ